MIALQRLLTKFARPIMPLFMGPMQLVSTPNRILGMSLPRRAGVFVFLTLSVLAVACFFWTRPRLHDTGHEVHYIWIVAVVVVVTPIVVEYMVRTWLDHGESQFPDIDQAWAQGLAKLREAALSLGDLPLFLVLGAPDEAQANSLMGASSLNLTVGSEPAGEGAPLRWFAGPDAAVLFVPAAGCLSRLAVKIGEAPTDFVSPSQDAGTMSPPPDEPGRRVSRTVEIPESFSFDRTGMSQVPRSMMSAPVQPTFMGGIGTLTPDFGDQTSDQSLGGGSLGAVSRRFAAITLTKDQVETATARLEHVCRLLLKERLPLCPINGILMVLPFELVARGEQETSELCNSVKTDLTTLKTVLQLRSQVIALFGGMERTEGFPELMRRLGPKVANEQQFGKGYNPRCAPVKEELSAVARHACGAFEDWTSFLLAQKNEQRSNNPRGNRQLYSLVCRIRALQQRIEHIIVNGFSSDGETSAELPNFFSGCYFAATGDKDDRRAFVTGVFKNRLLAQDNVVEWTDASLNENDWYFETANLLVLADVLLIGTIVTLLVIWWK